MWRIFALLSISFVLFPTLQDRISASDQASIEDLVWLDGCWEGQGLGGEVSLCWLRSNDNRITGVFQLVQEEGLRFVELIMISEIDGVLASRLKHFNADFTAWEDKDDFIEFPIEEIGSDFVLMEGKEYRLMGPDELHIRVLLGSSTGKTTWESFVYKKKQ